MREFVAAVRFLTVIPVPGRTGFSDLEMARSMAYYPLVGFCIGLILVASRHLFLLFFPQRVVAVLLVVALVLVTGALHLDGLSDTIDGLRSGRTRQERLRIMRDSRVGAFGAVGLVCILLLKLTLIAETPWSILDRSLILMATLGRWSMVQVIHGSSYARPEGGLARPFALGVGRREIVVSTFSALAAAVGLFGLKGVAVLAANVLLSRGIRLYFHHRLGGITGDVLGA
ncbi:MAG: adenosylcobinamide-GDP ribazoletransferase, partial [Deltaproteobacteria bacterium]|nr:adenosylcobinamide-GDP ribazoletransferase [Deltaproteobacteria bacterium]